MNKDKRNIDLLFEENLKKFRKSPPAHSWDRLEKDLNRENSSKRLFYYRLAAASLLILLAFGAGYFYATYNSGPDQKLSQESSKIESQPTSNSKIVKDESLPDIKTTVSKETIHVNKEPESKITLADNLNIQKNTEQPIANEDMDVVQDPIVVDDETMKDFAEIADPESNLVINKIDPELEVATREETTSVNHEELLKKDELSGEKAFVLDYNPQDYGLEPPKKKEMKWSVGAQFAPVWSYRDISINYQNQSGSNVNEAESQLNDSEDVLLSYAGGIDVNYSLSNRWSIQSGMYYSQIGQVNNNALNFKQDDDQYLLFAIHTSTGNIDIAFERIPEDIRKINPPKDTLEAIDLNNVKLIQNFDLFEIPVMIKYKILNKKLGINISGGLSPAYLLNNSTILQVNNDKYDIGSSSNLNTMIFNTSISLGIDYQLSKKLTLNLEPNFKYSLSPINNNSQFDYHPYYFSWFTGLRYKF
jgi:hypothetical protein